MTTLDDWPRLKRVLEEALARDGADRRAYLADACGTDPALRARIETLIAAEERAGTAGECAAALRGIGGLTVYPPASVSPPRGRHSRWRFVIKGPAELPRLLAPALEPFLGRRRRSSGMVEVEMDPQSNG